MNKYSTVVKLVYDLTRKSYSIALSKNVEGTLTISYTPPPRLRKEDSGYHSHIGVPGQNLDVLEDEMIEWLTRLLAET